MVACPLLVSVAKAMRWSFRSYILVYCKESQTYQQVALSASRYLLDSEFAAMTGRVGCPGVSVAPVAACRGAVPAPATGPVRGAGVKPRRIDAATRRSEEHTSELQSPDHLVCR